MRTLFRRIWKENSQTVAVTADSLFALVDRTGGAKVGGSSGVGNVTTVAVTDPVGNGVTAGDRWVNEISAQEWYWSGSAWNGLIGP